MKPLLTILLIGIVSMSNAQSKKWKLSGESYYADTTTYTYVLSGKDSVSVSIDIDNCGCSFWIDYHGGKHNSNGVTRHYLITNLWRWEKQYTVYKNDTLSRNNPDWNLRAGIGSSVDGSYTQNGKFIQPEYIIDKYGKHKVN